MVTGANQPNERSHERTKHNVDWMWVLFLWLLENIAQSTVSFKKMPQCGLDVAFVSMVTGEYNPIGGVMQEKATMWIRCGFCFNGY